MSMITAHEERQDVEAESNIVNESIAVKIKTLSHEIYSVDVRRHIAVSELKTLVRGLTQVAEESQRLIYKGKLLIDGRSLSSYQVEDGHTIHMVSGRRPPTVARPSSDEQVSPGEPDAPVIPPRLERLATNHESTSETENLNHLYQGIMSMNTLLSTPPQTTQPPEFFVGQWIDVKDTVNQWLESTVVAISTTSILVHYHGWPSRCDEWISKDSVRLAPFRTRTLHSARTRFYSPTPTNLDPGTGESNDFRHFIPQLRDIFRSMMPLLDEYADLCEESLREAAPAENSSTVVSEELETEYDSDTPPPLIESSDDESDDGLNVQQLGIDTFNAESPSRLQAQASFIAPLFDRLGRLLADASGQVHRMGCPGADRSTTVTPIGVARVPESGASRYRDLISQSSNNMPVQERSTGSIDIHIHAILAPSQGTTALRPSGIRGGLGGMVQGLQSLSSTFASALDSSESVQSQATTDPAVEESTPPDTIENASEIGLPELASEDHVATHGNENSGRTPFGRLVSVLRRTLSRYHASENDEEDTEHVGEEESLENEYTALD